MTVLRVVPRARQIAANPGSQTFRTAAVSENPDQAGDPADDERGILGSLSSTRPERIGRRAAAGSPPRRPPAATGPPTEQPTEQARPPGAPSAVHVATTVVQAAGELAQIGLTLGGQALRRAARRLPRI
jgi:hypothetical protein